MWPTIGEPIFEEEKYCTGFISSKGEQFMFTKKVAVTSDSIETWFKAFDNEIRSTMKDMVRSLLPTRLVNLDKVCKSYPSQVICLVADMLFSSSVEGCMKSLIAENRNEESVNKQFANILKSLDNTIESLNLLYRKHKERCV
jgi:hypothetical protein